MKKLEEEEHEDLSLETVPIVRTTSKRSFWLGFFLGPAGGAFATFFAAAGPIALNPDKVPGGFTYVYFGGVAAVIGSVALVWKRVRILDFAFGAAVGAVANPIMLFFGYLLGGGGLW